MAPSILHTPFSPYAYFQELILKRLSTINVRRNLYRKINHNNSDNITEEYFSMIDKATIKQM